MCEIQRKWGGPQLVCTNVYTNKVANQTSFIMPLVYLHVTYRVYFLMHEYVIHSEYASQENDIYFFANEKHTNT